MIGSAMKAIRRSALLAACASVAALAAAPSALGAYGVTAFDAANTANSSGEVFTQAGGHPYEASSSIEITNHEGPSVPVPDEPVKDVVAELPPGLLANPAAVGTCTTAKLTVQHLENDFNDCPVSSQIGVSYVNLGGSILVLPLYNMISDGAATRWAFNIGGVVVFYDARLRSESDYGANIEVRNINPSVPFIINKVIVWGTPAASVHDVARCDASKLGNSMNSVPVCPDAPGKVGGPHPAGLAEIPYVTMPTKCTAAGEGMRYAIETDSWIHPETFLHAEMRTHELPGYPTPSTSWGPQRGVESCHSVPFEPEISVQPTSTRGETPSGLAVELDVPTAGTLNPGGIAQSHLKKTIVTLPEGVTLNPSAAEGLGVCTPDQYARETATSLSGQGCPDSSKIGNLEIETPVLQETVKGNLYLAQQDDPSTPQHGAENPFDSLLALYIVAKLPSRGIVVKVAGKVEPDEKTGQIRTVFDDLPQLPFSKFTLSFREGARAPLVTPSACGTYTTQADFAPWSAVDPDNPTPAEVVHEETSFQVTSGVNGGSCPSGGVPPFHPGFTAGALNNNAGSYSPFYMRLTRQDGEQDMTKFSAVLPPGVSAKIAGVSKCPDAAIAAAKAKTGRQEQASPSCPANSEIGHILAGAGVGSVLTYVEGKVYLGGPYQGAPLSAVVVTPAVAGPFDVGTVITRVALTLDPRTAEVHVDGERSDPIPHILKGIPLKVRDLRVYIDRPDFTINPTSCNPSQVGAALFGSFLDVLSPADDVPVGLSSRFQAANCSRLAFKPKLSINLKGGTKRGGHPSLRAVLSPRGGDANIAAAAVTLPNSAFLDQAHIRTICTRVQYAAKACPPGAVYGHVAAFTPLLDEPLEGPVYLRSSNHKLPDLVFALHGVVDIEAVGRIDSVHGGLRASFEGVPDAPISKAVIEMQGGKKGLVVNSRNLCAGTNRADAKFIGQNGKPYDFRPVVKPRCGGKERKHRHRHRGA